MQEVASHERGAAPALFDRGRESARKHSPSLRTGRADLPHPALQSVVLPPRGVMSDARDRGRPHRGFGGKPHPLERVITMGNSQRASARPRRRRVEHPTGSARRHWGRGVCSLPRCSPSTFLRPLAPGPLRPFFATMDALTPARSVLAVLGLFPAATRSAPHEQVSLIPTLGLPTIPSPTTCGRFVSPRHVTCRRIGPRPHPHGTPPNGNSGLRHSLAGSPRRAGRIEFVILRTGRSPPAALHLVLRRRSCSRLQVTLTWRGLSPLRPSALSGALAPGFSPARAAHPLRSGQAW